MTNISEAGGIFSMDPGLIKTYQPIKLQDKFNENGVPGFSTEISTVNELVPF